MSSGPAVFFFLFQLGLLCRPVAQDVDRYLHMLDERVSYTLHGFIDRVDRDADSHITEDSTHVQLVTEREYLQPRTAPCNRQLIERVTQQCKLCVNPLF